MAIEHGYRQELTRDWIEGVLGRAGLDDRLAEAGELGGGTFNTVFRLRLEDGARLILKVAPPAGAPVMRYERGLLAAEALYYERAAGRAPVPEVVHAEPGLLMMTELPGTTVAEDMRHYSAEARARLRHALGGYLANLHTITGDAGFGYPADPLRPTWPEAFHGMVDALLADAADHRVELPKPAAQLRSLIDKAGLGDVTTPVLVHFDLWDGNILMSRGRVTGLIDAERAFWGDPIADFPSLSLFGEIDDDFLAGYRAAGGTFGEAEARRLKAYQAYLYLIMWIEGGPRRFTPDHLERRKRELRPIFDGFDVYC
ncbi:aminoglycoside phosphotransferase (APT) family kinase protein [Catenuloplanes nepalensis]|uniref:Aminoglycoside phosphotransferase (APT) family kinase protein n=1 Tax=Catenuloplanes nepalensis TaxID=587533 RepID=A0ABT9MTI5_9ACTN|nr:aminoglycoside phosphotransferase family protein [Catenuloplanes nepalensis]MDP9794747.1 aminoglycoside phosphotransferase (APT) family kinase protein [Catenuloplanes nepalensis]